MLPTWAIVNEILSLRNLDRRLALIQTENHLSDQLLWLWILRRGFPFPLSPEFEKSYFLCSLLSSHSQSEWEEALGASPSPTESSFRLSLTPDTLCSQDPQDLPGEADFGVISCLSSWFHSLFCPWGFLPIRSVQQRIWHSTNQHVSFYRRECLICIWKWQSWFFFFDDKDVLCPKSIIWVKEKQYILLCDLYAALLK